MRSTGSQFYYTKGTMTRYLRELANQSAQKERHTRHLPPQNLPVCRQTGYDCDERDDEEEACHDLDCCGMVCHGFSGLKQNNLHGTESDSKAQVVKDFGWLRS